MLPLTCPLFWFCRRNLTFLPSVTCSKVLAASDRVFVEVFSLAVNVFFTSCAVLSLELSSTPFCGQLHCGWCEARKKTWTRQSREIKMAIILMPVASAVPPNRSLAGSTMFSIEVWWPVFKRIALTTARAPEALICYRTFVLKIKSGQICLVIVEQSIFHFNTFLKPNARGQTTYEFRPLSSQPAWQSWSSGDTVTAFFLFSDSPLNLILCIVSRQNIWRRGRDVKKINSKLLTYLSTRTNIW